MIKYLRRLKTKIIIRIFWMHTFDSVRNNHRDMVYGIAYEMGRIKQLNDIELMEGTYEN